ncbi:flagellar basal-body rod protein FlgG [bacterium BMS3Abin05]|nr:flagellar basal-body rod protein FlgG [bacterium BMS3Abin05]GBE28859.1 flagellar basal-body rod protein FlgG [bacterium BMS3Bbin03]HDZ11474.1 flagellar basal-body rod protein FlgG [Bacteroidota bacterium]
MIRSLRTAATGMYGEELVVDVISNNLANINTTGFKKSKVEFQDLLYQTIQNPGVSNTGNSAPTSEIQIGHGTKAVSVLKIFSQGDVSPTTNPLDLAIDGEGFFKLQMPDGRITYTRDGTFKISADGRLVTSDGYLLDPGISLPENTSGINISSDGVISAKVVGETEPEIVGQLELAKFVNPAGLKNIGRNLFEETAASGQPLFGTPDNDGFGRVMQGYVELSNVDVVQEMVNMIIAQRAYEINSKAIKTSEEMLAMANNLKR